jgi:hypothetical protein
MDLHKIGIEVFAAEPADVELAEVIPVFHRWIRDHVVEGLLIDVADYSHVTGGPAILLVAYEGNYALGRRGEPLSFSYTRKQPLEGSLARRLDRVAEIALGACRELERATELAGRLRFGAGRFRIFTNDRLAAPNSDGTWSALGPELESFLARLMPGADVELDYERDPRERFALAARTRSASVSPSVMT